jgi:two-component system, OmpR family, phosphate regulon response regulator PhoB
MAPRPRRAGLNPSRRRVGGRAVILIVEDEADLQQVLAYNLRQGGHEVLTAASGEAALALVRQRPPDLIVLDLMLPGMTGIEVCRVVKSDPTTRQVAVLILTAKGAEIDRVVGFELGADDYVVKPFSVRELALRIQAILRRGSDTASEGGRAVEFGKLRIDRDAHRVWVEDREVPLTALEFRLLGALFDRRDRVQSRATLLDEVWGVSSELETRTVDTHVKRLREKLGAAGAYIETVRGVGYRFCAAPDPAPE